MYGKIIFALADVVAGWIMYAILRRSKNMTPGRAIKFASLWLLNPMVAQISTRGSSEGLLGVIVMVLLWAALRRNFVFAGCVLGFAVHFKIYPFIYGASILWWLDSRQAGTLQRTATLWNSVRSFVNPPRAGFALASAIIFAVLGVIMTFMCVQTKMAFVGFTNLRHSYDVEFLQHTFFYHFTRTDHRHNFSPYNILLYMNSSPAAASDFHPETLAFIPQILLSAFIIPLQLAKKDLPACMMAQTFAFVTFNKVCTSQVSYHHTTRALARSHRFYSISYGT